MFESPYRIAVIGTTQEITDNQIRWFYEQLKVRTTATMSLTEGDGQVHVAPLTPNSDHWLLHMQKRQHVTFGEIKWIDLHRFVSIQAQLESALEYYDEVWCFPALGRKTTSPGHASVLYRQAQNSVKLRSKFKFIPSWVEVHEPIKEAKTKVKKGRNPCLKNNWS